MFLDYSLLDRLVDTLLLRQVSFYPFLIHWMPCRGLIIIFSRSKMLTYGFEFSRHGEQMQILIVFHSYTLQAISSQDQGKVTHIRYAKLIENRRWYCILSASFSCWQAIRVSSISVCVFRKLHNLKSRMNDFAGCIYFRVFHLFCSFLWSTILG